MLIIENINNGSITASEIYVDVLKIFVKYDLMEITRALGKIGANIYKGVKKFIFI